MTIARTLSAIAMARLACVAAAQGFPTHPVKLIMPHDPGGNSDTFGFSIAIYPSAGMASACAALEAAYRHLAEQGSTIGSPVPAYDMPRLHERVGHPEVWGFERRFSEIP
ncbi:MAG: hypothetical protein AB1773_02440 [Pseudomonadota bacterium]